MKAKITKIIIFIIISIITFIYTVKWLDSINLDINDATVEKLVTNSSNLNTENKIINSIINYIVKANFKNPISLLSSNYGTLPAISTKVVIGEKNNPNITNDNIVYIYSTHPTEKYAQTKSEINLSPDVVTASYILQKELKKLNINSIVEEGSVSDILKTNNWNYASSYKVSRLFLENAKKKNPSLTYFVDLHRDSVSKKISTATIDGKKYAKVMFLVGLENKNYNKNLKLMTTLNNWLNKNYPGISRGLYKKQGAGVNGVYNQDFSGNCFLVEVGGMENTLEEVENTIKALAKMLDYYIGSAK